MGTSMNAIVSLIASSLGFRGVGSGSQHSDLVSYADCLLLFRCVPLSYLFSFDTSAIGDIKAEVSHIENAVRQGLV